MVKARMNDCHRRLKRYKNKTQQLHDKIKQLIPTELLDIVTTIADKRANKATERARTGHQQKLTRLLRNKEQRRSKPDDNWVRNISSRPLDKNETRALSYGLKHSVTPKGIPTEAIVEAALSRQRELSESTKDNIRSRITSTLQSASQHIVSFCGSLTYQLSNYLTTMLQPLTDKSRRKLQSTEDFINATKIVQIPDDYKVVSFDVKSLFPSIPLQLALQFTETTILQSTDPLPLPTEDIMDLLNLCLTSAYFQYNGKHYKQVHGKATGSPVSVVVAEIVMQHRGKSSFDLPTNDTALVTLR